MTTELKITERTQNFFPFKNHWIEENVIINGTEFDGTETTKNKIRAATRNELLDKIPFWRDLLEEIRIEEDSRGYWTY